MSFLVCKTCHTVCDENMFCFNPVCIQNPSYKLHLYTSQHKDAEESVERVIRELVPLLKNFSQTLFITGIGKSAHLVKKSVATWQSLGLKAHSLLLQDLFHGDLGLLKEGDFIMYITNSGNTEELLAVANYIKKNFSVRQICISNNPSAKLAKVVDNSFTLCNFKIQEADILNCAPSVSCSIFMMLLDILGIHLAELKGITREEFKQYHPGGDLGKSLNVFI